MARLRLALIGAFPFPYPQGSQIFVADQARALAARGADIVLFSYGRGAGPPPADLRLAASPHWASPRAMRSGPQWGKPLADWLLRRTFLRETLAADFDFALAHNAEAALIALSARRRSGLRVAYVAHTLLRHELSAYAPRASAAPMDQIGAAIDRTLARRADAVVALSESARSELAPHVRGPLAVIPPGLDAMPAPAPARQAELCRRLGLPPGGFALYAGNLDAYQELDLLAEAALRGPASAWPIVVATHDAAGLAAARGRLGRRVQGVALEHFEEMRVLTHAAGLLLLTRRRPGGFPVKLLNYMESGRPTLAFDAVAEGLVHGESAWLMPTGANSAALASALATLQADAALRRRLGEGARHRLEAAHAWPDLAERTLELLASIPPRARRR